MNRLEVLKERDALRKEVAKHRTVLAFDTPWPITEVLSRLADAAEHLLGTHGCDILGHEGIRDAMVSARQIFKALVAEGIPPDATSLAELRAHLANEAKRADDLAEMRARTDTELIEARRRRGEALAELDIERDKNTRLKEAHDKAADALHESYGTEIRDLKQTNTRLGEQRDVLLWAVRQSRAALAHAETQTRKKVPDVAADIRNVLGWLDGHDGLALVLEKLSETHPDARTSQTDNDPIRQLLGRGETPNPREGEPGDAETYAAVERLGHTFRPAPFYPDKCDAKIDDNGRPKTCARPREEHETEERGELTTPTATEEPLKCGPSCPGHPEVKP